MSSFDRFWSRRSVVHSTKGIVASSNSLATAAGVKVLEKGGNCVMACVAVSAVLGITEPHMTGIGGDNFCLFYNGKTGEIGGLNGSGKSPAGLTIDLLNSKGIHAAIPGTSPFAVTVPGCVAGWIDAVEKWGNGKLSLAEILEDAIDLAENGVMLGCIAADAMKAGKGRLSGYSEVFSSLGDCYDGQVLVNKPLAEVFRKIAKHGKAGFYEGEVASNIVGVLQEKGGVMTLDDLKKHKSLFIDPIKMDYLGHSLVELPPNGAGLVALLAMGTIKALERNGVIDMSKMQHNSPEYLHVLAEVLKFAFKDSEEFVADPETLDYDPKDLLSDEYLDERAKLFSTAKANPNFSHGVLNPKRKSDTCFFAATDSDGNACSFIASVCGTYGSAIVPKDCGFALQNRGCGFSLKRGTRNSLLPEKRPYHTIIPALITKGSDIYATYGVMGGYMQPQGHLQVYLNMILFGMNPQEALDAPRICIEAAGEGTGADHPVTMDAVRVNVEDGISQDVVDKLKHMGHDVVVKAGFARNQFGRGQVIKAVKQESGKVYWSGGSDLRGDGCAGAQC